MAMKQAGSDVQPIERSAVDPSPATAKSRHDSISAGVRNVGLVLAAAAFVKFAASVATIVRLSEANWGEALIHDHASRLLRGEHLYQPWGETFFSVATYTPLYYYLVAGLQAVFGPGFGPGRMISLLATIAIMALIARVVWLQTKDWRAGAFAAALFLVLGVPAHPVWPWSALYKEDMLSIALSFGAIVALAAPGRRYVVLAGVLAGLAFLTKQTTVIAGLTMFVWLLGKDYREAAVYAVSGLVVVVPVCLVLEMTTGNFLSNTLIVTTSPFRGELIFVLAPVLVWFLGGAVGASILYLYRQARTAPRALHNLMVYHWFVSSLLLLIALPKMGTDVNHFIPFAAPTAVLATLGLWQTMGTTRKGVLLLAGNLFVTSVFVVLSAGVALSPITADRRERGEFRDLVSRVREEPTMILTDPPDVAALAGRPILTEPWAMSVAYHEHIVHWNERPLLELICSGKIGLVVLGFPVDQAEQDLGGIPRWPPPAAQALREATVLERAQAGRYVYVYRPPMPGGICQSISGTS